MRMSLGGIFTKNFGTKRFGLDGGEAIIPALEQILKRGSQLGLEEVVIGMAHRGRLNVLHNVLQNPSEQSSLNFMEILQTQRTLAVLVM